MKMKVKGELCNDKFILTAKQDKDTDVPLDGVDPSVIDALVQNLYRYLDAKETADATYDFVVETEGLLEDILEDNDIKKVKLEVKKTSDFGEEYISTLRVRKSDTPCIGLDIARFMREDHLLYKSLCDKYPLPLGGYDFDIE